MSDPYKAGKFKANPYYAKVDVSGNLVVILDGAMPNRELRLITPISRCIRQHEIHELILTDENAKPGATVNNIAYLGFVEIQAGGAIISGDDVYLGSEKIGTLAGFDETHMPNHINIVINSPTLGSGKDRNIALGEQIKFKLHQE